MKTWLMKSEPSTFSIQDLKNRPDQTEPWSGVRNYQARNFMMKEMEINDMAFFYHSSCEVPGIVGLVTIASKAYAETEDKRWWMVDVKLKTILPQIIPLSELRTYPELEEMQLLKKGQRLSIQPVKKNEFDFIYKKFFLSLAILFCFTIRPNNQFFEINYATNSYTSQKNLASFPTLYPSQIDHQKFNLNQIQLSYGANYSLLGPLGGKSGIGLVLGKSSAYSYESNDYPKQNSYHINEFGQDRLTAGEINIFQNFHLDFCGTSFCFSPFIQASWGGVRAKNSLDFSITERSGKKDLQGERNFLTSREHSHVKELSFGLNLLDYTKNAYIFVKGYWKEFVIFDRKSLFEKRVAAASPSFYHSHEKIRERYATLGASMGVGFLF